MKIAQKSSIKEGGLYIHIQKSKKDFPSHFPKDLKGMEVELEKKNHVHYTLPSGVYILIKTGMTLEQNRQEGAKCITLSKSLDQEVFISGKEDEALACAEGFALASYKFVKYFSSKEQAKRRESIIIDKAISKSKVEELSNTIKALFWARDMVNEPVSYLNAEQLSEEIKTISREAKISTSVLEKSQIEALKMGGLLAVNKGSIDPPTFTIMEYKPSKPKNKKPIVLVGKGVVYDTGGLSLKPTAGSMDVMKSDMGGAAAVAGSIYLMALQKLDIHVVGLIPATDNRPGLNAYAPGDIIKMYNGKTVEVLNTDAEGRMILADALSYSKKYNPELVMDAATLTGAALRAIGHSASIMMGNAAPKYFKQLEAAGSETHDRVVQFPFWDEYGEEMKSKIADLKNLGGANAGMITAGKFLENFVEAPYVHIDIAGPAWYDAPKGYYTHGGTGAGVKLFYQFAKNY